MNAVLTGRAEILGVKEYFESIFPSTLEVPLYCTKLVVDGYNIAVSLHKISANRGHLRESSDYDRLFHIIFQFYKDLLRCNVFPLVILDGGLKREKLGITKKILRRRIHEARYGYNLEFVDSPLLRMVVIDVLEKLEIPFAMSIFEAKNDILFLAKSLNVPILSNDRKFFIYDAKFIPLFCLGFSLIANRKSCRKKCYIYHVENLLEKFQGLDVTVL
ncbi:hypothetical protein PV325_013512, partial [Microctonus aethiopoides]